MMISVALTASIFGALAYLGWRDRETVVLTAPTPPATVETGPVAVPRQGERGLQRPSASPAPPVAAGGIHKCRVGGRIVYQDGTCPGEAAEPFDGGTFSVVDASKGEAVSRSQPTGRQSAGVAVVGRPDARPTEPPQCRHLRMVVSQIDAAARRRSTQRLTDERRHARDRMYELGCREID